MLSLLINSMRRGGVGVVTPPPATGAPNPVDFTFTELAEYSFDENPNVAIAENDLKADFPTSNDWANITSFNLTGEPAGVDYNGLITMGNGDNFLLTGITQAATFQGVELILGANQANLGRIGLGVKKGNQYACAYIDLATRTRHTLCHDGTNAFLPSLESDEHKTASDTSTVVRVAMQFGQNFLRLRVVHANNITNDYIYQVSPNLIINNIADNEQWEYVIYAGCDQSANIKLDRIKIGRPVVTGLQNHRAVQYTTGEPVVVGNEQYFTASATWGGSSPGTIGSTKLWSIATSALLSVNTETNAITVHGVNICARNGRFYTDAVVHITVDKASGLVNAACGTHGNFDEDGVLLVVTLVNNTYTLSASNVLTNQNTINIAANQQAYDPSLNYENGTWYCAMAATDDGFGSFYPIVYKSTDLDSWVEHWKDTTKTHNEGATIYKIGSTKYALWSGETHFQIYNLLTGAYVGQFLCPNPGVGAAYSHPCLLPLYRNGNTKYRLMTMGAENNVLKQWYYEADQQWIGGDEWAHIPT